MRLVAALALAILALTTGAVWASGSVGPAGTAGLVPTTTTSPGSSTTTQPGLGPLGSTTTTSPAGGSSTTTTSSTVPGTTTTTVPPSGGDAFNPLVGSVPPEDQAIIDAFVPTPPGDDKKLIAELAPLASIGMTPEQAAIVGFGRFPVAAPTSWSDGFLSPRFSPAGGFNFHHAVDIPAPCGTPIRSPDSGVLTQGADPGGGTTVEIAEPDGTYMYLAHLSGYAAGTTTGQPVVVGEVLGYVGETGLATGCHLHLEIHPRGGAAVDPKPFVDAWYAEAVADAPVVVGELLADHGRTELGVDQIISLGPIY